MSKENKMRRKAIDCKMVGPSTTSPGYFKYEVTIQEESGEIHKAPAYGVDMQDAISRLVWTERILVAFALAALLGFLMIQLDKYFKRGK
ncbi:MAG: hypothetical protein EBZ94_06490 [Crocinitomicaceae bacterium]|nr:hypothetical protein [Crocinitomicaceae bacterium]